MSGMETALGLLSLQLEWGADEALLEAPLPRLATDAPPAPEPAAPRAPMAARNILAGVEAAPPRAGNLDELRAAIAAFTGCALRETATNPVLPEGDPAGGLLVIGEPPVAEDDRTGRPFSGAAGTVLDRLLGAIGLARGEILLAPLLPWRPPGNRPPTDAELAQCLPLLHQLIVLARPRHIVLTGILPVRALLGAGVTLRRSRGKWTDLRVPELPDPIPDLPVFGLGNLKSAAERRDVWSDWRMLHRTIHLKS